MHKENIINQIKDEKEEISFSLRKNGFYKIENFFSKQEVEFYVKTSYSEKVKGDLLSSVNFGKILLDERVLSLNNIIFKSNPYYFRDSGVNVNNHHQADLHKDNTDRRDYNAPDWASYYPIYRFGIYLGDFKNKSGGLLLRKGSNQKYGFIPFLNPVIYMDSSPGDLIIWNLKTDHSGFGLNLKFFKFLNKITRIYRFIPSFMKKDLAKDRILITWTLGEGSSHLDRYLNYLKLRTYAYNHWSVSTDANNFVKKLKAKGYKYIDVISELDSIKKEDLVDGWEPQPY